MRMETFTFNLGLYPIVYFIIDCWHTGRLTVYGNVLIQYVWYYHIVDVSVRNDGPLR